MSENPAAVPSPEPRKLSVNDPVDQETLQKFSELQTARLQVAERILDLEQDKIRALRAVSNIDNERQRLFEGLLISRGLAPNAPVEIDAKTGRILPVNPDGTPKNVVAGASTNGAPEEQVAAAS